MPEVDSCRVLAITHGAQKLFGWLGVFGFSGTMGYLTDGAHLAYIWAIQLLLVEGIGASLVLTGFLTRIKSLVITAKFPGVMFKVHWQNGFFMNWSGAQKGEDIEFFLLIITLAIIPITTGGG